MTGTAELIGIARKARSHAPMETLDQVDITTELGLDGDYRGKLRRRQITILAEEDWQAACQDIDRPDILWTARRVNLLVRGIALPRTKGTRLTIGAVVFDITGETDPCNRMDDVAPGLQNALSPNWRGGVTCRVITGGTVSLGDAAITQP